jgi:hypothetical protein
MANDKKKPWGRVYAVVPGQLKTDEEARSAWIELGVAWMNHNEETGKTNLRIDLKVEPVAWRDPHCPRVLDVQKIEEQPPRGKK